MEKQQTNSRSDCDVQWKVDCIWQSAMTSSVMGLRRASKALPKAKLSPKRGHGHCLVVCCPSDPLLLSESWLKPLHLRSMLNKLMSCTKNCNACSQHWSTVWAQFFSMTTPDCTSHNQCFKSWTNWAMKFCLIHHSHLTSCQLTTTSSIISKLLASKMLPQPAKGRKCFLKFCQIPKLGFLCYRNKQTYFSLAQMCWL